MGDFLGRNRDLVIFIVGVLVANLMAVIAAVIQGLNSSRTERRRLIGAAVIKLAVRQWETDKAWHEKQTQAITQTVERDMPSLLRHGSFDTKPPDMTDTVRRVAAEINKIM